VKEQGKRRGKGVPRPHMGAPMTGTTQGNVFTVAQCSR